MDGSHTIKAEAKAPTRRTRDKEQTRAKIIVAAKALFETPGGYAQATIRKIAKAVGMSTGAVFANFKNKEDLWRAAMECDPPLDGPATWAALPMLSALRGLMTVRPSNWEDDEDPDQVAAWRAADAAIALAEGSTLRTACAGELPS